MPVVEKVLPILVQPIRRCNINNLWVSVLYTIAVYLASLLVLFVYFHEELWRLN